MSDPDNVQRRLIYQTSVIEYMIELPTRSLIRRWASVATVVQLEAKLVQNYTVVVSHKQSAVESDRINLRRIQVHIWKFLVSN